MVGIKTRHSYNRVQPDSNNMLTCVYFLHVWPDEGTETIWLVLGKDCGGKDCGLG